MPKIATMVAPVRKLRIGIFDCFLPQQRVTEKNASDIIAHSKITPTVTDGKLETIIDTPIQAPSNASHNVIRRFTTCEIFFAKSVAQMGTKNNKEIMKCAKNGDSAPPRTDKIRLSVESDAKNRPMR
jgi:hypothetical protein